jgi:hypothetical protein
MHGTMRLKKMQRFLVLQPVVSIVQGDSKNLKKLNVKLLTGVVSVVVGRNDGFSVPARGGGGGRTN